MYKCAWRIPRFNVYFSLWHEAGCREERWFRGWFEKFEKSAQFFFFLANTPTILNSEYRELCFKSIVIMLKWISLSLWHFPCAVRTMPPCTVPFTPPDPALPTNISRTWGWRGKWDQQRSPHHAVNTHHIHTHPALFWEREERRAKEGVWK